MYPSDSKRRPAGHFLMASKSHVGACLSPVQCPSASFGRPLAVCRQRSAGGNLPGRRKLRMERDFRAPKKAACDSPARIPGGTAARTLANPQGAQWPGRGGREAPSVRRRFPRFPADHIHHAPSPLAAKHLAGLRTPLVLNACRKRRAPRQKRPLTFLCSLAVHGKAARPPWAVPGRKSKVGERAAPRAEKPMRAVFAQVGPERGALIGLRRYHRVRLVNMGIGTPTAMTVSARWAT